MTSRGQPPSSKIAPVTRKILVAVWLCLAGLALIIALGDIVGSPTDRSLATAVSIGG